MYSHTYHVSGEIALIGGKNELNLLNFNAITNFYSLNNGEGYT